MTYFDTFDTDAEIAARDEFDAALYESPEAEAYFMAEAEAQQEADYQEWLTQQLLDDPQANADDFTVEDYTDSLLADYAAYHDLDI